MKVNYRSWRWLVWLIITVGMNTVLATLETSGGSVIKRRKLNISLSTWPVFSFRRDFQQQLAPPYFLVKFLNENRMLEVIVKMSWHCLAQTLKVWQLLAMISFKVTGNKFPSTPEIVTTQSERWMIKLKICLPVPLASILQIN